MVEKVSLDRATWEFSEQISDPSGFGAVYAASSDVLTNAVLKFVPKGRGADRELLFVNPVGVRNVVPIADTGETDTHWVLAMPRAEKSLKAHLAEQSGPLNLDSVIAVLADVTSALIDLERAQIVHRDIKPANTLLLDGTWCLADFGISRYAEATTAPDTHKFSATPQYAAPERWRSERATSASDVYSLGIMAYEMVAGRLPFTGDEFEIRNGHLHLEPSPLHGVRNSFAALIEDCLSKSPGARPTPENLLNRLARAAAPPPAGGLARLDEANLAEVKRRAAVARAESEATSELERRVTIAKDAARTLRRINDALREAVLDVATAATIANEGNGRWTISLNRAHLTFSEVAELRQRPWGNRPAFDVLAYASIGVRIPGNSRGWEGRSHALYFCDAKEADRFGWFETAFMHNAFSRSMPSIDPFALPPDQGAAALGGGMAGIQLAWPFMPVTYDDVEEFVNRWTSWFAEAATGVLGRPGTMPEHPTQGSYRTS
ncbi:serine/threonine-protein kinase [Catellatospora chokoriensis]|uniref:mitogen-activated protein kinase kinase n=1 Tax=Catellatospora chokoriensis TaxID=310353 RepID=A0A8J3K293_9ACTN|nr:serine/threonine-protein kinase [Catellatospora chokoriensis]GIF92714.1 hypothetical protein Cch02nite_61580 [Catellatospora chokoriensis]